MKKRKGETKRERLASLLEAVASILRNDGYMDSAFYDFIPKCQHFLEQIGHDDNLSIKITEDGCCFICVRMSYIVAKHTEKERVEI